jgi:hypothetical protein
LLIGRGNLFLGLAGGLAARLARPEQRLAVELLPLLGDGLRQTQCAPALAILGAAGVARAEAEAGVANEGDPRRVAVSLRATEEGRHVRGRAELAGDVPMGQEIAPLLLPARQQVAWHGRDDRERAASVNSEQGGWFSSVIRPRPRKRHSGGVGCTVGVDIAALTEQQISLW